MIALFLWLILSGIALYAYSEPLLKISDFKQIIAAFIITICGPILVIAAFVELILDYIFPEGWDD